MNAHARAGWSIACIALCVALPGSVLAQAQRPATATTASSAPPGADAARALFDEGVHFMEDGRFADAVDRFERARALRETPAVIFNLAIAQRGLGRYVAAAAGLQQYLSVAGTRLDPQRRGDIEGLLTELRGSIVHARVRVNVAETHITIDGHPIAAEALANPIDLDPGPHTFRATREGYSTAEVIRAVDAGESTEVPLDLHRVEPMGVLRVETTVENAAVFVDSRRVGTGVYEATLRAGNYSVEVRSSGYITYSGTVLLRGGASQTLHVTLDRVQGITSRWWFWTAIGTVVVVGAGAVLIWSQTGTEAPERGTLNNVVQAIQAR